MVGMYEIQQRRAGYLPMRLENAIRSAAYGGLGVLTALVWRPSPVLIFSHMRAGSTLLSQLLGASPEVSGFGELKLAYSSRRSFWSAQGKVSWAERQSVVGSRWSLDKVLHDHFFVPETLETLPRGARVIFLIREPNGSISSLMGSFGYTQADAFEYYSDRLESIRALSDVLPSGSALALRYRDLIDRTPAALSSLADHLDLSQPLRETYQPNLRSGAGDPSANLQSGRILRTDKLIAHDANIRDVASSESEAAFAAAWSALQSNCTVVGRKAED